MTFNELNLTVNQVLLSLGEKLYKVLSSVVCRYVPQEIFGILGPLKLILR